jgi:glycosyltransferase 2 family protein
MHAFDFSVSFVVLMLMNGLVNLATTLPAAPGYIGTFDTPGIMTLTTFGVDPSVAASYTFTLHAALWVPVTLLGGFFFWRNHLNMSDIETARRQQAQEEAAVEAELQHKETETHLSGEGLPATKQTPAGGTPVAPEEVRAI